MWFSGGPLALGRSQAAVISGLPGRICKKLPSTAVGSPQVLTGCWLESVSCHLGLSIELLGTRQPAPLDPWGREGGETTWERYCNSESVEDGCHCLNLILEVTSHHFWLIVGRS